MKPRGNNAGEGSLRLGRKFWISFLTACVIVFVVETLFDRLVETEGLPGLTQSVFNFTGLYQWMVGARRKPLQRVTAVVKIDSKNDAGAIGKDDICGQREQTARTVCRIGQAFPKVIVLDKFYGTKECGKPNEDLRNALRVVSQHIPVVVGRLVPDDSVLVESRERYYLEPSLAFVKEAGSKMAEGVVNIDRDTRKLPLQWLLYPSKEDAQRGQGLQWYDTLALAAAKQFDGNLLVNRPRLWYLLNHHRNPYIGFLREDEFHPILVSEVLASPGASAGSNQEAAEKAFCADEKSLMDPLKISGKVVVIGELDPIGDVHQSVVRKLPGYVMQANFIEALLDDRYYRPMPVLDYVYGFVILAALELILIVYERRWIRMALLIAGLLVASVGVLYLTTTVMEWYVNPIPVGLMTVLVKLLGVLFTWSRGQGRAVAAASPN